MAPQTQAGFEQFNNILACWNPSVLIDCQQYFMNYPQECSWFHNTS